MAWKVRKDPLFRGDAADGVAPPTPAADPNLVRHILHIEGYGRQTPYMSTSEERVIAAKRFAGRRGRVWETDVSKVEAAGAGHISNKELQGLLKGTGKGKAAWTSAAVVARARQLVIMHREHILDFSDFDDDTELRAAVRRVFGDDACTS